MSDQNDSRLRIGDPVKLKDSDLDLRGDVWQLRTGRYVVVRWEDECRSTHSATAIEEKPRRFTTGIFFSLQWSISTQLNEVVCSTTACKFGIVEDPVHISRPEIREELVPVIRKIPVVGVYIDRFNSDD